MANDIRELVTIAKKMLAELRFFGATLLAVKKQVETVAEEQKDEHERQQPTPVLRAELQIPEAITCDRKRDNHKKVCREWVAIGLNALTLLSVAAYAVINYRMLCQIKKSASAAEKANSFALRVFEDNERAAVFPDEPVEFLDQGVIKVTMRNTGKKAAGPFFLWIVPTRWKQGEPRPIGPSPNNQSGTFRPDARRIPAGGHLDFMVPVEGITPKDVAKIRGGTEQLFVYVNIMYNDGFGKRGEFNATFQYIPNIGWVSNMPTYGTTGAEKVPDTPEE